ncbi:MAG: hypothetical protein V4685_15690 [Bacteroidota bacterium]
MNLRLISSILCLVLCSPATAQLPASAFSFNCTKDTVVACGQNCITLKATIPAIGAFSNHYTVNKTSCFRPNVSPATPGTSAGLTQDDRYSPAIFLPFIFPFYENYYDQLIINTNGIVSFDTAEANEAAQWIIQGLDGSLPSTDYDRAVIMGPFHDIDISRPESPNRQIKYEVVGQAPHRKFVVSYYKVPCFDCNDKFNNTYQVSLYEGLGLVEVHVFDRETCTTWNGGAAMIGMQNYNQDNGIMAPGRSAFTAPRWSGIGMNEAWRFAPKDGGSLLKKVELYKPNGEFVSAGDTVNDGNGNYNVSFPNVCLGSDNDITYLIKATYKNILDPSEEVYSVDTMFLSNSTIITPSVSTTVACPGGLLGSITVTNPVASEYEYSLDGTAFQSSPVFDNLPAGAYQVMVKNTIAGCTYYVSAVIENNYRLNTKISYTKPVFCNYEVTTAAPLIDGVANGRFSITPASIIIDSLSGSINFTPSDTGLYNIIYRIVSNDSCVNPIAVTTVRIVDTTQFVWTGAIDSTWENSANWPCNNLPTPTSNVIIYSGTVVINSNVTINSLTVYQGANVVVNSGFNLTVLHP